MRICKTKSTPGRLLRNSCWPALKKLCPSLQQLLQLPLLTHRPLGSWNMQHIRCLQQFSTTKKMHHVHPRCDLVRDQMAKGRGKYD
jgi:hypothetical protein